MALSIWTDFAGLPIRQAFYDAKGIRTRVIECGEGNPETLVFLHGTGGHAEAFSRNLRAHGAHLRVVSMDMIGHGYTDAPDIPYSMGTLVEHLGNLVDALGCKQVSVCGESLGAMVGAHYAIQHPDRVKKLVLNTGLLMRRDESDRKGLRDVLERTRKATGELTRDTVRARLNWLMYEPEKNVTEELIDIRYAIYSQPGRSRIIGRISQEIMGGLLDDAWVAQWSNENDLRKLRCPVLIMWSSHNPGLTEDHAREAMKFIPDAQIHVLKNSAHWPQWEEPEEYNKVHLAFLRG